VVSRIPLRAASILNAWHRARSLLIHGSLAPDTLLPVLAGIYGRLLHRGGKPPGDRVPLRELVARLRRSRRGYSRAQVAFDLARLRCERRLHHGIWRIDIGIATGLDAADPKRVVWIEDQWGSGHYYLYFRMLPQRGSNERADPAAGAQDS